MAVTLICTHAKYSGVTLVNPGAAIVSYVLGYETGPDFHDVLIDNALLSVSLDLSSVAFPTQQALCDLIADDAYTRFGSKPTFVYVDGVELTPTP